MRSIALSIVVAVVVAACSENSSGNKGTNADGGTGPEGGGSQSSAKMTVTNEKLDVAGTSRSYVLAVPKSYSSQNTYPLVLVFHGDGGDGAGMRKTYPLDELSGDDAIVAYPDGLNQGWNLYEASATNGDLKFVEALLQTIGSNYNLDTGRVFGVGYSAGGYLINQVACRRNGFFRGIVVHAAGAPDEPEDREAGIWPNQYTKCKGQQAAPVGGVATLSIRGENDDPGAGQFAAQYWAGLNGCPEPPTLSATSPSPCEAYDGCPTDLPVVWCKIPGLGHSIWNNGVKEGWAFIKGLGDRTSR
jgi:polyhydroxybutyrate depolymerase